MKLAVHFAGPGVRLLRSATRGLVLALLGAGLVLGLAACDDKPQKKREMQKVKLLPDTPPPPPPPPKPEEKKPEPKPEDKPQQQQAPKPDQAPEPQVLKTDEAPGEGSGGGPVAGTVTQDYTGGQIGGGTGGAAIGDRLAATSYANAATRALNEYLNRDQDVKQRGDYRVQVQVWLDGAGRLQRSELVGSTGDPETDAVLRKVLSRFPGLRNPPPENMPQPLRLQVTNRMIG